MKIVASADWRDAVPFETPVVVNEIAPGDPAHCVICGSESELRERTELWAVKHRHPKHHDGFVRFYCAEHVPAAEEPAPAAPAAKAPARKTRAATRTTPARQVRTPAVRRAALVDEAPRAMCPDCYVEVSALGICGMCGSQVA
ncbi:glucose-6-phosphate dehydrogenase [Microbacterium sp. zg-YB36]|uniref:glucose-6-phosphate dehydrogenase n=1 Tax=Microbacterium sp. zg-YB36 TaxID=2969407 RepID=UPI00214ACC59|nr:glucose-6-phosphate dehydrogenase [Microbacterium sp. zg-YB36]MDL5353193.1 glucose-6-phosphate dehydrogenase [Microbacterium sp. zg-YB36]